MIYYLCSSHNLNNTHNHMQTPILSNIIYYTTSDNQPIKIPTHSPFLGGNILAHAYDGNVAHIVFDKPIEKIGSKAFAMCKTLTSITIPESVESIGMSAFRGCDNLENIAIPHRVHSIGNCAFQYCKKLSAVSLPDGLLKIGQSAFSGCISLKSIYIPNSVTTVDRWAFTGCLGLEYFEGDQTSEDKRCIVINKSICAFAPAGIEEYVIPNNVTSIQSMVFAYCLSIKRVVIENDITIIGSRAFADCSNLRSVYIGDKVAAIESGAFAGCKKLRDIHMGNRVESIGGSTFENCKNIKNINLPDKIHFVGNMAFEGCCKLKNIAIASIGTWMNITFESFSSNPLVANYRGANLYVNGELLENLIIPCNVTEIDDRFRNCLSIKTITLPDGLIVIRDNAFMGCRSLLNVYIPSSVTSIGRAAFWGCCNLSNINIPYSVNYIGENAFSHCEGLRKIKGKYASEDERSLIFDGILKAAVLLGFEDYFIPDNVTTIERCVLDNEFVVDMDAVRKNGLLN